MTNNREYFDLDLKTQSKKNLATMQQGLSLFGGIIHDQYENKYFKDKLSWRNPLLLRISLPAGLRYKFILHTKLWLYKPEKLIDSRHILPKCELRGNHDRAKLPKVRTYKLTGHYCYVRNHETKHTPAVYIFGNDLVSRILDGELDLLL